jgi:cell division protease FtsH
MSRAAHPTLPWRIEGIHPHDPDHPATQPPHGGQHWAGVARRVWWWVILFLLVNWVVTSLFAGATPSTKVSYSFFRTQVSVGNVTQVTAAGDVITGSFRAKVDYALGATSAKKVSRFTTQRPAFSDDQLVPLLLQHDVTISAKPVSGQSLLTRVLIGFGPTLLFIGLLIYVFRRSSAAMGAGMAGMGRSKAKLYERVGPRTTFADVAGIDEVQQEVMEVVEFLREPERFRNVGAQIPRGVLLYGAPGTGKTLLARAVAGEADVPFFSMSASEFIEMIVGVGASRVRDLFAQAKKVAPAIIFIDELDAIGRSRGGGVSLGGHDEREQTLNQILTEMDGFTGAEGVVVLAATNRPEILDPALLRPGRFDRRVAVNPPDQVGREQILRVHTRSVPLEPDVDLAQVASITIGMVGADLRNLVNEAALLAAKGRRTHVAAGDFSAALDKVVLGSARHIMLSPEEKRRTAVHEAGHALVGMLTPGADPVRKVSIIPRGQALGVTLQAPPADRYGYTAGYLRGRIVGALAGRAAEQIVLGDVSTGADSDLEQATETARQMVGRWGMSEALGPVSVLPAPGRDEGIFAARAPSQATLALVDAEVRRILQSCFDEALDVLGRHRNHLDPLTARLLEQETLDDVDAYLAAGLPADAAVLSHRPAP